MDIGQKNKKTKKKVEMNKRKKVQRRKTNRGTTAGEISARSWADQRHGVVYIGNLPYGFFEKELEQYFSQFGRIIRANVPRSTKRTGKPLGIGARGYVQFADDKAARVAAKAMNNYLMFEQRLECRYVKPFAVKPLDLIPTVTSGISNRELNAMQHNAPKSEAEVSVVAQRMLDRIAFKNKKLAAMGIDYQMEMPTRPPVIRRAKHKGTDKMKKIKKEQNRDTKKLKIGIEKPKLEVKEELPEAEESMQRTLDDPLAMIVDSSEDEITFRTPPGVVKKRRLKPWKKTRQSVKTEVKQEGQRKGRKRDRTVNLRE